MDPDEVQANKSYALSGRIMLSAIVILFFVVIMMVCLHLYARWYLLSARRRQLRRARRRRTQLVFYVDPSAAAPSRGLDYSVLKSLPVFTFKSGDYPDPIECAVCLSEFEENETGRTLPKCKHSFHVECIDMWFHSHSTCPLCRSPVEPVPDNPTQEAQPADLAGESSSDLCSTCQHEGDSSAASTSSFGGRRKPAELAGVTIEIPSRNGSFDGESVAESPAYRSPMSRMLSFRRILSRERRGNVSPSCGESEVERGETQQTQGKFGGNSVV